MAAREIRALSTELCEAKLEELPGYPSCGWCPSCQIPVDVMRPSHPKQEVHFVSVQLEAGRSLAVQFAFL